MQQVESKGYQFRTFQGVFTPSILTILGVIMYLRYGWVLGNVGLTSTLVIVTLATSVTFITALSISEFATNMRMGAGGAYYILSRSLGLEAGAAIGLPMFFAKALGISFYVAGFAESVVHLYPALSFKLVGVVTLVVLAALAYFSADMALKLQYAILTVIAISLVSFFMGSAPVVQPVVTGMADPVFIGASFWVVFAVFFPAVTGIEAGLSMSGDLQNPERSLPKGILLAVIVSYVIYMAIPVFMAHLKISQDQLLNNGLIMRDIARWGDFIVYGIWCAALSSALGSLLGAPRTLQALASDGVVFRFLGKGCGKDNNPRMATVISFLVALAGIFLGGLNAIATILSMFFLISYGLLNLAAGMEGLIANPSWRPKFRVHWIFPLLGALECLLIMLMINAGATIIALGIILLIYYLMQRRNLSASWGDMKYGILMLFVRMILYKLTEKVPHAKTWRPNILVLSGAPTSRWHLIALADAMSHGKGLLTVAAILSGKDLTQERRDQMESAIHYYLRERAVPSFVKVISSDHLITGAQALVSAYGFGPLEPNTILLGETHDPGKVSGHAQLFQHIYQTKRNLVVVREPQEKPSRQHTSRIDLWLSHAGMNSGLMLALAYLIKTSPEWAGARLVLKSVVEGQDKREQQLKYFRSFIEKENIDAEVEMYIPDGRSPFDLISEKSVDADIVFLGMKPFVPEDSVESYGNYYQSLLEKTKSFSMVVFVLAAEDMDFNMIFRFRK
ncbi:MAG: Na-K-Cl cotransporter [Candidatus Omnitrophota bacterium]